MKFCWLRHQSSPSSEITYKCKLESSCQTSNVEWINFSQSVLLVGFRCLQSTSYKMEWMIQAFDQLNARSIFAFCVFLSDSIFPVGLVQASQISSHLSKTFKFITCQMSNASYHCVEEIKLDNRFQHLDNFIVVCLPFIWISIFVCKTGTFL